MVTLVCTLMWREEPLFVSHACGYIDADVCKGGDSVRLTVGETNERTSEGVRV